MSFLFPSGSASDSEPTSLSSTPVQRVAGLDDSPTLSNISAIRPAEDTTLPTTLPTSLPESPNNQAKSVASVEAEVEEIYTLGTRTEHDTLAFDLDFNANDMSRTEQYLRSPSSSSSASESSESSDSVSSSDYEDEREKSVTTSQWATLGESSYADKQEDRELLLGSPSTVTTILPTRPFNSTADKGKAPERPGILRTEGVERGRHNGEDRPRGRRRVIRRRIYEDGISRDFILIVALCIGLASAGLLITRAIVVSFLVPGLRGWDFDTSYPEWP